MRYLRFEPSVFGQDFIRGLWILVIPFEDVGPFNPEFTNFSRLDFLSVRSHSFDLVD